MSTVTRDAEGTVTGNTYDKYGSSNPVVKKLMASFERTLDELWAKASPRSVLDVGCGEGVLTHKWAQRLRDGRIVGVDLEDPAIQAEWVNRQAPNLEYKIMKAENLPFADGEFELAAAIEVLEHVPDAEHTVAEMARVARGGHLLVSVPREPLWRGLNMARGAYIKELGNTPGHLNHWSRKDFVALLGRHGTVEEIRSPFPWTMLARPGVTSTKRSGYGAGAKILSIGIASTGVVTFAYFSVASYALNDVDYKAISLLWSVLFVIVSVIYRPIEQLLSRTIADRRARGLETGHPLRTPMLIQAGFALAFLVVALALKGPIEDGLFDGSAALYWVLVVAVLAYAASYFARGWLAGHQWFALYGALVFMEATSRLLFAVAVAIGIASGQTFVALGMAAAPFVSLVVVPYAFSRRPKAGPRKEESDEEVLNLARGGRFAVSVLCIMIAEQTLLNGGVLAADINATDAAVAGYVFNALLIARAPLQLFQAVQGSLLPHLAGLEATQGRDEFNKAIRITILAIAGFAGAVAVGLLLVGPFAMSVLFDDNATYGRLGLAAVAIGMGAHLAAGTLNQAALARDHAGAAAAAWLVSAVVFVAWMLLDVVDDALTRAEVGYLGAASLLCALLAVVYRRSGASLAAVT